MPILDVRESRIINYLFCNYKFKYRLNYLFDNNELIEKHEISFFDRLPVLSYLVNSILNRDIEIKKYEKFLLEKKTNLKDVLNRYKIYDQLKNEYDNDNLLKFVNSMELEKIDIIAVLFYFSPMNYSLLNLLKPINKCIYEHIELLLINLFNFYEEKFYYLCANFDLYNLFYNHQIIKNLFSYSLFKQNLNGDLPCKESFLIRSMYFGCLINVNPFLFYRNINKEDVEDEFDFYFNIWTIDEHTLKDLKNLIVLPFYSNIDIYKEKNNFNLVLKQNTNSLINSNKISSTLVNSFYVKSTKNQVFFINKNNYDISVFINNINVDKFLHKADYVVHLKNSEYVDRKNIKIYDNQTTNQLDITKTVKLKNKINITDKIDLFELSTKIDYHNVDNFNGQLYSLNYQKIILHGRQVIFKKSASYSIDLDNISLNFDFTVNNNNHKYYYLKIIETDNIKNEANDDDKTLNELLFLFFLKKKIYNLEEYKNYYLSILKVKEDDYIITNVNKNKCELKNLPMLALYSIENFYIKCKNNNIKYKDFINNNNVDLNIINIEFLLKENCIINSLVIDESVFKINFADLEWETFYSTNYIIKFYISFDFIIEDFNFNFLNKIYNQVEFDTNMLSINMEILLTNGEIHNRKYEFETSNFKLNNNFTFTRSIEVVCQDYLNNLLIKPSDLIFYIEYKNLFVLKYSYFVERHFMFSNFN